MPPVTPVPETAAPELTATPEPTPAPDTAEATCVASRKAKKYHRPSCQYAAKIKDENLVTFDSAAQAQAAGYAPCGACKPIRKTALPCIGSAVLPLGDHMCRSG